MDLLNRERFSFHSSALPEDTFALVSFTGEEGLSRLYQFELLLASRRLDLDLQAPLDQPATLTCHRPNGQDLARHGILCDLEQLHEQDGVGLYRAHLVPRLWRLTLTLHQQVFLGQTVRAIIQSVLQEQGLGGTDEALFKLSGADPARPFVCQYQESHWAFLCRWLEREGIYFYFEHRPEGERVVFIDDLAGHEPLPLGAELAYRPVSGLEQERAETSIQVFSHQRQMVPGQVLVKGYATQHPALKLEGRAQVHAQGRGQVYHYGDNLLTVEEGARLAGVRRQELLCRHQLFRGESAASHLLPGFRFHLSRHFRADGNRGYLVTEVSHQGSQADDLVIGLAQGSGIPDGYHNTFRAIPDDIQFRPPRETPWPRVSGTLSAWIDSEGSGDQAQLDAQGRYLVRLPFDLAGRKDGKASAYVSMAQPYAGSQEGMHFPLRKGTEVILTFLHGDPDRPVIAGAVPNPATLSPVREGNASTSRIVTPAQNELRFQYLPGAEHIVMSAPMGKSFIGVGNAIAPEASFDSAPLPADGVSGVQIQTGQQLVIQATSGDISAVGGTLMAFGGLPENLAPDPEEIDSLDHDFVNLLACAKAEKPVYWYSNLSPSYSYQQGRHYYFSKGSSYYVDFTDGGLLEKYLEDKKKDKDHTTFPEALLDRNDQGTLPTGYLNYEAGSDPKAGFNGVPWTSIQGKHGALGEMNKLNTAVFKRYGNSYSYYQGDSVNVTRGNDQSIVVGGRHVNQEFSTLGKPYFNSVRELTEDGYITTIHEYSSKTGWQNHYSFNDSNFFIFDAYYDFVPRIYITSWAHPTVNIEIAGDMELHMKTGMGGKIDLVMRPEWEINGYNGSLKVTGPGTSANKYASIEARVFESVLLKEAIKLSNNKLDFSVKELVLMRGRFGITDGIQIIQ